MKSRRAHGLAVALALTVIGSAGAPAPATAALPALPPLPVGLFAPPGRPVPPPRPSRPHVPRCTQTATNRAARGFAEPVFPCDFADPSVIRVGRSWYAYATTTGWERGRRAMPILRSTDLRHWRHVGDALAAPPRWASRDVWAPTVLATRHGYLLYFSATRRRGRVHCLAVATARRPTGPFRAPRALSCGDRKGRGYIDAAPLRGPGGRLYLYFSVDGPAHSVSVLPLSRDGVHVAGRRRELFGVSRRWQRGLDSSTVEGPSPVWRNGRCYLFYSTGYWGSDYRMGYAVARSPLGPFRDFRSNPILRPARSLVAPGGGTVFPGPHGSTWLAFHAWSGRAGYGNHGQRTMRVAPLRWHGDRVSVPLRG